MSWLIIRIERAENTDTPEATRPPPVETIPYRISGGVSIAKAEEILNLYGWELGPIVGEPTPITEWPFTAVVFEADRKSGDGRRSQNHRWPVRIRKGADS